MKIPGGVSPKSQNAAIAVQRRMGALVAQYAEQPRGFSLAWCNAFSPSVVSDAAWDSDFRSNLFDVPKAVTALADADAKLIAAEIQRGGPQRLVFELEAACVVGGLEFSTYLAEQYRKATRPQCTQDAAAYYSKLDGLAADWQRALMGSGPVASHLLEHVSRAHYTRVTNASPLTHDTNAILLITGARNSLEIDSAAKAAAAEARRIPPHESRRIVEALSHGTLHTVSNLSAADFTSIIAVLAELIAEGKVGDVRNFMQHFRECVRYSDVGFADTETRERFERGEFEQPLRDACAARGLDYLDYNGIFSLERFHQAFGALSAV